LNAARARLIASWLLLAFSVYLLRYRIALTSDSLFYDALANDLLVVGGRWRDWKFSAAPGFVPDMLAYFMAFPLLPDAVSRMHAVSALQAGALALLSSFAARAIAPALRPTGHALIVLLTAFATLVSAKSGMWLYFHTTNNHVSALLAGLLLIGLLIRFLEAPSAARAALAIVIAGLATASSGLFLLTFGVPALLLACAAWLKLRRGRIAAVAGIVIAGQLLGLLIGRLLIFHLPLEARGPLSAEAIANSAAMFLQTLRAAFAPDNLSTLVFSLTVALCLLFLLFLLYLLLARRPRARPRLRRAKEEPDWKLNAAGALLCLTAPITVAGMILSAAFIDAAGLRYLMFPIALTLILAVICLDRILARARAGLARLWLLLALVIGLTAFQHAKKAHMPVDDAAVVAQCLAGLESQGVTLRAGVADYWNARAVSHYLPRHQPILATLQTLRPLFWVSTAGPFLDPQRYPRHYDFVVLRDDAEPGQFFYTVGKVGALLPPPAGKHTCAGGRTHIWTYGGDELDTRIDAEIARFLDTGMTLLPP